MNKKFGMVIIDTHASELDRAFTYIINEELLDHAEVGMRVLVPFGRGNKLVIGLLVEIKNKIKVKYDLKEIIDILDDEPIVSKELMDLAKWMRKEYISPYNSCLQLVLPPGNFKDVETYVELLNSDYRGETREEEKILKKLSLKNRVSLGDLKKDLNISRINKHLKGLKDKNIIRTNIEVETRVQKKTEKWIKLNENIKTKEELFEKIGKRAKKQLEIGELLFEKKDIKVNYILKELNTSLSVVREIEKKGLADIYEKIIYRQAIKDKIEKYKKHKLNREQLDVYNELVDNIDKEAGKKFLLHGVTGSGKTEVYLQIVEEMLKRGRDSIILVPEIALTPQTIDRFAGRFGEKIAIIHSRLTPGEKFDEWRKIREGKVKIAVGARSAVFAPFKNLGLIIIDEEHENTYKSSQTPKYDTIEVAEKRIELEGGNLLLGTATPSINTIYKTINNEYHLLELKNRVRDIEMPKINLVDMREELNSGNRSIFSFRLQAAIERELSRDRQIILFLNRRGFSTFVSCRNCGYVVICDNCDISLTYHKNVNRLRCHYCGLTKQIPKICPSCSSKYIKYFGIGTQQVEYITKELFPNARVARMDSDTTNKKGKYTEILGKMKSNDIDILIGTQMIAKGLDFENVTLVGVIAADTALNMPNYTSAENTFQLITQVAGRAGRGNFPGEVILQSYNPEHYSIVNAKKYNYYGFVEEELLLRKEFLYPPYIDLVNILVYSPFKNKAIKTIKQIYNIVGSEIYNIYGEEYLNYIIGPNAAMLERIKENYRYQILIKIDKAYSPRLKDLIYRICISNNYNLDLKDIKISIETNPNFIL